MNAVLLALALVAPDAGRSSGPKLTVDAPDKVLVPGRKMPLRLTIENEADAEVRIEEPADFLAGLEIRDQEGKLVKEATKAAAGRSSVLPPGGFVGRTVDLSPVLSLPAEKEGWYRVRWSLGDAASNTLEVLVLREWLATVETNLGNIVLEFYPKIAPNHVLNFLRLSRSGFYEGSVFHRVIPGFMMQGGMPRDPKNEPKTKLKAEFSPTKHVFGTLSAARGPDPDSATSQFFICFAPIPFLDNQYTVFGQVLKGEEVVKEVEQLKSDHNPCKQCGQAPKRPGQSPCCGRHHQDRPELDVIIKRISLAERKE